MTETVVATVQCQLSDDWSQNLSRLRNLVESAVNTSGANVLCLPELPAGPYFPQTQSPAVFAQARTLADSEVVADLAALSKTHSIFLPASFFEKDGNNYYNSVAAIDRGEVLGVYRKCHIPDGPGYQEKYYFTPGRNDFKTWDTSFGRIGIGICWDQWFPEAARAMALQGADILLYPTAIGSEPAEPNLDSRRPWRRVMQGHAVANCAIVAAANRFGREQDIDFYGTSFVSDQRGEVVDCESGDSFATMPVDLDALAEERASWGFFRDRRPELYGKLGQ